MVFLIYGSAAVLALALLYCLPCKLVLARDQRGAGAGDRVNAAGHDSGAGGVGHDARHRDRRNFHVPGGLGNRRAVVPASSSGAHGGYAVRIARRRVLLTHQRDVDRNIACRNAEDVGARDGPQPDV